MSLINKIITIFSFFLFVIFLYLYWVKNSEYKKLLILINKKDKLIRDLEKENIELENKVYVLELSLKDSILYKIIEDNKDELKKAKDFFK